MPAAGELIVPNGQLAWPPGMAAPPQALGGPVNFGSLMHAFRRRWVLGTVSGLACALAASILAWLFVPVNQDISSFIQIRSERPKLAFDTGSSRSGLNDYVIFKHSQAAMIRNPFVINRALNEPGIMDLSIVKEQVDPVLWLTSDLDATFEKDSEIMVVTLSGENAKELVDLVNAITDSYIEEANTRARNELLIKRESLERRHVELQKQIEKKTQMYQTLAEQLGTPDSTAAVNKANMDRQQLEMLRKTRENNSEHLLNVTLETQTREAQLAAAEGYTPSQATIDYELSKDPQYGAKLAAVRLAEEHYKALDQGTADKAHRQLMAARDGVKALRKDLDDYKAQQTPLITEGLKGAKTDEIGLLKLTVATERQKQNALTARIDELDNKIQELTINLQTTGKSTAQLEQIKTEVDYLNVTYKEVAGQFEAIKTELDAANRIVLIQKAEAPQVSSQSIKIAMTAFAGVIAFCLPVVGVAFVEHLSKRLNGVGEITDSLGIAVVGMLPSLARGGLSRNGKVTKKKGKRQATLHEILVESIDGIRTTLMLGTRGTRRRVIMVTSASDREGKTTLATQLAASLARAGRRTLLIDADLRHPSCHRLFELPLDPGFCEVLREEVELQDVIRPTRASGLWMISAGRCDQESIQALAKDAIGAAFESLRCDFDFIVVDSGPVLSIADSLLVGRHADAVILSVLRDVSQVPKIYEAHERLSAVGIPVMGAVVGGVKIASNGRVFALPAKMTSGPAAGASASSV